MTEVSCVRGEPGDSVLEWSCGGDKNELHICGRCQSCVLSEKLLQSTQWMSKATGASQRRFLTGILVRCQSLQILEDLRRVLQVTSGKDFTYVRSKTQQMFNKSEDTEWLNEALDDKMLGRDMLDTWEWFRMSPSFTKSKFLLGVLSVCDTNLLHILGNLVRILIVWEKRRFLQFSHSGLPQEASSCCSQTNVLKPEKVKEAKSLMALPDVVELDSDSSDGSDPALTVVPRSSKSLSGVSRHKDFIRSLPVNIAKMILGNLDKATLQNCRYVSKHWQCLTDEIFTEKEVKKNVEKQAMILQGNSTSKVNPVYAKIREILVPISEGEGGHSGAKFTLSQEREFNSIYKGTKTMKVQMEERNVFCGVYNMQVLLKREDPSRVIDYAGGQLVAIGSKDRTVKFLHVSSLKETPLVMQGHAGSVRAVLICEERKLVISSSYDLSIRCWSLKSGICIMIFHGHFGTINCLDVCGYRLVSGAKDCRVKVWNLQTGKCFENLKFKHLKPIMCVKINETWVISSCAGGQIRVWSMEAASLIRQINGHQGPVLCLCFDQWHILSGGSDGVVKAWSTNWSFKKCLRTFQHPKEVLTMSLLFLRIVTGCMDGRIRIFNFLNGDCLRVIKTNMKQYPILSLHTHSNTVVINTRESIQMLQFAEVQWDYSASANRNFFEQFNVSPFNTPQSPDGVTQRKSSSPKRHFIHFKSLTVTSVNQSEGSWQKPSRSTKWNKVQQASIKMQTEMTKSSHSEVQSVSIYKNNQWKHIPSPRSTTNNPDKSEIHYTSFDTKCSSLRRSEKAVQERVKKRGPHHFVSPDLIVLRAGSTPMSSYSNQARSNMELNARVRDAWGPESCKEHINKVSENHTSNRTFNTKRTSLCFTPHSQRSHREARASNKSSQFVKALPKDGQNPKRLLLGRNSSQTDVKTNSAHVSFESFRSNEDLQLKTDTQEEAFFQKCTRLHQVHECCNGDQPKAVFKHSYCHQ